MKRYQCIPAGDYLALVNATAITPTQFVAQTISTEGAFDASITFYVKGALAACSENITFVFQAYDALHDTWDTAPWLTKVIAMNGVAAIQETIPLVCGIEAVRLYSVANAAAGGTGRDATVNASIFVHF